MIRYVISLILPFFATVSLAAAPDLSTFTVPPGFSIEVLLDSVPNARSMVWGSDGTLFVSTRTAAKVYAVKQALGDEPEVIVVADDLKMPNGVAFFDGDLYVAELTRILRFPDVESQVG